MTSTEISLVVLSHGLWGVKGHMNFIERQLNEYYKGSVHVLNACSNEAKYTYDGIDICGKRLANEIEERVALLKTRDRKKVTKISFVGYSLGGLIIRFAIGLLGSRGFFHDIEPNYYVTFATPHMGVRLPQNNVRSRVFNFLSGKMVSRTGEQLQLNDVFVDNKPIIYVLSDPKDVYYQYLEKFKYRRTYANTANDRTVPYWTAGLELLDFFQNKKGKLDLVMDEKYNSILTSFDLRSNPNEKKKQKKKFNKAHIWRYVFVAVSPILLPIFLFYAFFYVGIQGLVSRHRVAYLLNRPTIKDVEENQSLHAQTGEFITDAIDTFNLPGNETSDDIPEQQHTVESPVFIQVEPSKALSSESKLMIQDETTKMIYKNLRTLDWERVWVYLNAFNAHGTIVCRQKRFATEGGKATIQHFVETTRL